MKKINGIISLALIALTIIFSCNNGSKEKTTSVPVSPGSEQKVQSVLDSVIELKRKELIQRIQHEIEMAGRKILDLGIKQKTAETKVKTEIDKEIKKLKERNEKLAEFMIILKEVSKDRVQEYEKRILELIKN